MANLYNSQLDAFSLYHEHHLTTSPSPSSSPINPALPALGHALAGSIGTAISNLSIYPLDLIITRLQVQRSLRTSSTDNSDNSEYQGVLDAFEKIYKNEGGVKAFYSGVFQDTGKSVVDSFLFFLFYNYLRTRRLQKNGGSAKNLPALEELVVGALAGACSKFFTTPISNIVTRKQTASMISARSGSATHEEPTVADIFNTIKSTKGYQGFWSGYSASLVLTLNPSLTFFLYEFFKRTMLPRAKREDPGARITFLMAAVAKAFASTVTYPFSLAKARAQAESKPAVDESTVEDFKVDLKAATSSQSSARDMEKNAKDAAAKAKKVAKRNNVFTEILKVYRTEGPAALYEGVYGEILKGFFSHGITMLVKEAIHKVIIKAYFVILRALGRLPSPGEVVEHAEEKLREGAEGLKSMVDEGLEKGREVANEVAERTQGALQSGYTRAGDVAESTKETLSDIGQRASVLGSNATNIGQNVAEGAQDAANSGLQSARDGAQNLKTAAKEKIGGLSDSANPGGNGSRFGRSSVDESIEKAGKVVGIEELKSEDAGHLLGNAQEMLGDNFVNAGESIKGKSEE